MKKILILILILAAIGALWFYLNYGQVTPLAKLEQIAQQAFNLAAQTAKEISLPPPLRATKESPTANLTRDGVLQWTNSQRKDNGLPALKINQKLNLAAEAKVKDMFAKQYFEHVSPSGVSPSDLLDQVGYAYILAGQNLALGNFANDQALVQAWMDSPGHRANIVGKYTEIGIAVGRGIFNGRSTWLAVQEFGKPLSACPSVSASLQTKINSDQTQLKTLEAQAATLKAEIISSSPHNRQDSKTYNQEVDQYNSLVSQINALISQLQGEITIYNRQVDAFNTCIGS